MEFTIKEKARIKAIQRYIEGEKPVEIYIDMGYSKPWFYKWLARYNTGKKRWYKEYPKMAKVIHNRTNERIEQAVVDIRKTLMEGTKDYAKYSCVGAEAIQFHMEELGYQASDIPSISTIKRIIKRNKLRVNKPERYKRVRSKGRYTIIKPKFINEMHQMDLVGPRYIKGYGSINSIHIKDVIGQQVWGYQYKGKGMDNVMDFLLDYWKQNPIPKYLQVDNGMCFVGNLMHLKSFSRFVRLTLYVGIEVIFIAPSKPWMNGTIEEFNKEFDNRFWKKELFTGLDDIRGKSQLFYKKDNKFKSWKLRNENIRSVTPRRMLSEDFTIDVNNLPLVTGKIHFIRIVDFKGRICVLNEYFNVGKEYIGEYVWAIIETRNQLLTVYYNDENLIVREIKRFCYKIPEKVRYCNHSIFVSG